MDKKHEINLNLNTNNTNMNKTDETSNYNQINSNLLLENNKPKSKSNAISNNNEDGQLNNVNEQQNRIRPRLKSNQSNHINNNNELDKKNASNGNNVKKKRDGSNRRSRNESNLEDEEVSKLNENKNSNEYVGEEDEEQVMFPGYVPYAFKYLSQRSIPRYWCLKMITSPWFERISMLIIIINCITLGMYQPCNDNAQAKCTSTRCMVLQYLDHAIFGFFAVEMCIKMCAMGLFGKHTYMAETWNRLDFFIVLAGTFEYAIATENLSLSAIRTIRVLRPLRAINRVPSMRILVMLLLDTLPMLGNVLLLCFFVFFIFGIIGVQMWKGVLRNRCYFDLNSTEIAQNINNVPEIFRTGLAYYKPEFSDSFICSQPNSGGMSTCGEIPPFLKDNKECNQTVDILRNANITENETCVNWNMYFTVCRPSDSNPFNGAISFDNIGFAWVAIFQIISLESWVTIMYYIQDAHSFYDWIYFVFLIVIGSFFMINLCLVVIATQFSETKRRETERMIAERRRFSRSSSTILSEGANEPGGCWEELIKYILYLCRKAKKRVVKKYTQYKNNRKKNSNDKTLKLRKKSASIKENIVHLNNTNSALQPNLKAYQLQTYQYHLNNHMLLNNNQLATPNSINSSNHLHFNFSSLNNNNNNNKQSDSNSDQTSLILNNKQTNNNELKSPSILTKLSAPHACFDYYQHSEPSEILNENGESSSQTNNNNEYASYQNTPTTTEEKSIQQRTLNNKSSDLSKQLQIPAPKISVQLVSQAAYSPVVSSTPINIEQIIDECALCKRFAAQFLNSQQSYSSSLTNLKKSLKSENNNDVSNDELMLMDDSEEIDTNINTHLNRSLVKKELKLDQKRETCLKVFCCCCYEQMVQSKFCIRFYQLRDKLKLIVDSKFFQRTILCAILINTLSMGVEHHEQPAFLTLIVEYSNFFFTIVFFIEMVLKISAYGMFEYIKNAFNLFDGIIVGVSVYEVFKQVTNNTGEAFAASGVSVLRTFRLLRILKLVRFMPALRRQLVVMLKTIDNVATFFSLLILFIFIFSILGMNLFGCKFCNEVDGERVCERKNFDSLLWAIITVFQILTQEDWNEVLYNGMEKTSSWAALYFIALMTFGNYVLFNLLVAILVEGFSSEDEPKKPIEERILEDAMHAIEEEELQKEQHLVKHGSKLSVSVDGVSGQHHSGLKKNSPKENRKFHIPEISISGSAMDESNNKSNLNASRLGSVKSVKIVAFNPIEILTNNSPKNSNINGENLKPNRPTFLTQLPIITHTCPTPVHTPSNPSINLLANNKEKSSEQTDIKGADDFEHRVLIKNQRSISLDTLTFRPKGKSLNRLLTKSTGSKIFERNTFKKPEDLTRLYSFKRISIPSLITKIKANKSADEKTKSEENSTDLQVEIRNDQDHIRKKSSSRSLNQPPASSSLALPPVSYKHRRTKSEKSKRSDHQNDKLDRNDDEQIDDLNKKFKKPTSLSIKPNYTVTQVSEINNNNNNNNKLNDMNYQLNNANEVVNINCCTKVPKPAGCFVTRRDYSLYLFSKTNPIRRFCMYVTRQKWFDYTILFFIALNCITLAMERPNIPPNSIERKILINSNYVFTIIFTIEMLIKILSNGLYCGEDTYLKSGWNKMDGFLVFISLIDVIVSLTARSSPKIFGILRVFRLLRTLRPLRVISRAPGLKLVVQTLLSSLRPIGNIVLICCTFFIIFGILGVQLFKGKLYYCVGDDLKNVHTRDDCLANPQNQWVNSQYNFDNLGQALMALFVLSSKDGWVQIMYTGIDAVGVDKQPVENYNEWMLVYFISFLLLVGFFVLNMFVGVVIENFHKCREEQEREEKARRAAKRAKKFVEKQKKMKEIPYYANYSPMRRFIYDICNSKYFDLIIAGVIGLNVVSMSLEFYRNPDFLLFILDIFNYIFTFIFLVEAIVRLTALGFVRYFSERWNQLDIIIVILSILGIIFDNTSGSLLPVNPTIIRVMRVLRIARVLKLLKMAKGIRSLLDTVIQALPQVGNLGLLFFLLFFIFAILGVELFGRLNCEGLRSGCDGLSKHAHFHNFGMAFLTLFRIATGDNWNGIMKDTLKDNVLCEDDGTTGPRMCLASILAPIYFVIFVLMAQFVLVNVVVAVLMKHLDDSNKTNADDAEMDEEIEKQLEAEARNNVYNDKTLKIDDEFENESYKPMNKQSSLPPNFTFELSSDSIITPIDESKHSINNNQYQSNKTTIQNAEKNSTKKSVDKKETTNQLKQQTYQPVLAIAEDESESSTNKTNAYNQLSSPRNSINNETDYLPSQLKQRRTNKASLGSEEENRELLGSAQPIYNKSHYSPKSSVKIKIIDETDTDN